MLVAMSVAKQADLPDAPDWRGINHLALESLPATRLA
jgi:hypothetical protein